MSDSQGLRHPWDFFIFILSLQERVYFKINGSTAHNVCPNLAPHNWHSSLLKGINWTSIKSDTSLKSVVSEERIRPVYLGVLFNAKTSDQKPRNDATADAGSQLWCTGQCGGRAMNTRAMPVPACLTHKWCTSKKSLQCNNRRAA